MKDPHEPVRWDASESDASDELRRALAALADSERPQADALQRVRERLLTVFEAPPPRRVRLVHALGGSIGMLAIGLALVAGLTAWLRFEHDALQSLPLSAAGNAALELARPSPLGQNNAAGPERSSPGAHAIEASNAAGSGETSAREVSARPAAPRAPEREDAANARGASRARAHGDRSANVRGREVATAHSRASEGSASTQTSNNSAEHASAATVVPRVSEVSVAPSGESPVEHASATVQPSENSARVAVRNVPPDGPRQPAADGGQAVLLDEATLLQRARRLSSGDPAQALRLLEEHKRRFPAGMLSPEREVLAIELLRSLSRTQEAERRAREFRRDYPKSVYLSRIQP